MHELDIQENIIINKDHPSTDTNIVISAEQKKKTLRNDTSASNLAI